MRATIGIVLALVSGCSSEQPPSAGEGGGGARSDSATSSASGGGAAPEGLCRDKRDCGGFVGELYCDRPGEDLGTCKPCPCSPETGCRERPCELSTSCAPPPNPDCQRSLCNQTSGLCEVVNHFCVPCRFEDGVQLACDGLGDCAKPFAECQ